MTLIRLPRFFRKKYYFCHITLSETFAIFDMNAIKSYWMSLLNFAEFCTMEQRIQSASKGQLGKGKQMTTFTAKNNGIKECFYSFNISAVIKSTSWFHHGSLTILLHLRFIGRNLNSTQGILKGEVSLYC